MSIVVTSPSRGRVAVLTWTARDDWGVTTSRAGAYEGSKLFCKLHLASNYLDALANEGYRIEIDTEAARAAIAEGWPPADHGGAS